MGLKSNKEPTYWVGSLFGEKLSVLFLFLVDSFFEFDARP